MKYDFDHWDKEYMTQEEALAWFESELEVTDGERCCPTCPQCQANEWAVEALSVRWHKYPVEKPPAKGVYLVCSMLSFGCPQEPTIELLYWGKSWECEERDNSLKKKKAYWYDTDSEWGDHTVDDVYAWMPLPKPMSKV